MEYDELIDRAIRGDKKALVTLIMDRRDEYFKLAFSYMKKEEDAMDCLQDMIVRLYTNIHKLKNKESFYSWSKTILDYDYKTIGKILDIPLGTVKSRIYKGKRLLKNILEGGESGVR